MVRKSIVAFGLLAALLVGAIWLPLNFRGSGTPLVSEQTTETVTVTDEAPAEVKLEETPAAQAFTLYSAIYQAALDEKELAQFEKETVGLPVVWLGKIVDVPATGEHLVIVPLVSAANENFEVFVVAKLDDPNVKLSEIAEVGNLIILDGVITSGGTSGPIVTANQFMIGKLKDDTAKVE